MKRHIYRSLDRPATFFGIRGRFMIVMGLGAALSVFFGIIVGGLTSMLVGMGALLVAAAGFYILTMSLQSRIDEKDIWKMLLKHSYPDVYRMKPKHIRNIWKGVNLPNTNTLDKL